MLRQLCQRLLKFIQQIGIQRRRLNTFAPACKPGGTRRKELLAILLALLRAGKPQQAL